MAMENQNTEWKLTWKDEYLKWICGFANAQGGSIYIGCDNDGKIVGVPNARKLLEDIPNKVRDVLGILADVDLLRTEEGAEYLRINVQPSLYPVSCKGEYHYRAGSTRQQLQGGALTQFLLQRMDSSFYWDAAPVADASLDELEPAAFAAFRKGAVQSGRMTEESAREGNEEILKGLGLIRNGVLTRAAVLLFHPAPERWFTGAYAKIAFFPNDADIAYMDEIHGSLFVQAERIIDILYLKYLKAAVSYSGINRVETYPFPGPRSGRPSSTLSSTPATLREFPCRSAYTRTSSTSPTAPSPWRAGPWRSTCRNTARNPTTPRSPQPSSEQGW